MALPVLVCQVHPSPVQLHAWSLSVLQHLSAHSIQSLLSVFTFFLCHTTAHRHTDKTQSGRAPWHACQQHMFTRYHITPYGNIQPFGHVHICWQYAHVCKCFIGSMAMQTVQNRTAPHGLIRTAAAKVCNGLHRSISVDSTLQNCMVLHAAWTGRTFHVFDYSWHIWHRAKPYDITSCLNGPIHSQRNTHTNKRHENVCVGLQCVSTTTTTTTNVKI